jgi:hypothetical protein
MRLFRTLTVCALLLALPTLAWSWPGGGKEKKHLVHGAVLEIKRDADKDNGSFTMQVIHKKARAQTNDRRTFQVTADTKFVTIHEGQKTKAFFKDLHEGQHVAVQPLDDRPAFAARVAILVDAK